MEIRSAKMGFLVAGLAVFSSTALAVEGEIVRVNSGEGTLTVKHQPIPSFGLPAATTIFRAGSPAMTNELKPHDVIFFEAGKVKGAITVVRIERTKRAPTRMRPR